MLDNKTLDQWLEIRDYAAAGAGEMYMEGSKVRDKNPTLTEHLFTAARILSEAARQMDRTILLASAEEKP